MLRAWPLVVFLMGATAAQAQERRPGDVWTEPVTGSWGLAHAGQDEAQRNAPAVDLDRVAQDYGATVLGHEDAGFEVRRTDPGPGGVLCYGWTAGATCYEARRKVNVTLRLAGPASVEEVAAAMSQAEAEARAEFAVGVTNELIPTLDRVIAAYGRIIPIRTRLGASAQGVLSGLAPLDVVSRFTDAAGRVQDVSQSLSVLQGAEAQAVLSLESVLEELDTPASQMVGRTTYWYEMRGHLQAHAQYVENLATGLEEALAEPTPGTTPDSTSGGGQPRPDSAAAGGGARPDSAGTSAGPRRPAWLGGSGQGQGGSPAGGPSRTNPDGTLPGADRALLILMDASGSMGQGNKMAQAKSGAIAGVDRAGRGIWIMVASFSGECGGSGVTVHQDWTQDRDRARAAVQRIQANGGTPLAPALSWANSTVRAFAGEARRGGVILLADGENSCGSVSAALSGIQQGGVVFHNEAIGVGLEGEAIADMEQIAQRTGGNFHDVRNASGIRQAFDESFTNLYRFFTSWEEIIRQLW